MSKASQRAHAKSRSKRRAPGQAAAVAVSGQDRQDIQRAIATLEGTECTDARTLTPAELAPVRELLIRLQGKMGQGATLWFGREGG